ncbi:TetR/AcrR family transcriptional regulator [Nocardia sp. CA2R105]|uniref:TetR/AcrR family transcriptional regulator n=1 Tax=Nocardia coffeae TaxID=2873381 RepID=UPI001CA7A09C|nr:TetR/AcrR family transcriptional regulator [Nocardia coffeae]MBY8863160.1 TetR/AcrR family transcriptional regulator [Nocardia coffeae]
MDATNVGTPDPHPTDGGRREQVLAAALDTFVRYGYRKTSMEDVARAADISRPGLYLMFGAKRELFTAAVTHALDRSIAAVTEVLADPARPIRDRLLDAFDQWTGRYIGAMSREVNTMAEEYSDLLGPAATEYPSRFAALLDTALTESTDPALAPRSAAVAQTLISTSIGIKQQVTTRAAFLERLAVAIDLIVVR